MGTLHFLAGAIYRFVMLAGSLWCHQIPGRSPHVWGVQLPLCWRCSGILVGSLVLLFWLIGTKRLPPLALCILLALLMPLDVFHAIITRGDGDNTRRLLTGLLWGFCATTAALRLIRLLSLRLSRAGTTPAPDAGS